jgi:hypothetical protein
VSPIALRHAAFVDTSGWYALLVERDTNHAAANRQMRALAHAKRMLVVTNYVIGETYTLLRRRRGARAALGFLSQVRASNTVKLVRVEVEWEQEAEELLEKYREHELSYADATSFVTMRQLGLSEALSFDLDFAVAGFRTLH